MWRALIIVGMLVALSVPAVADQTTVNPPTAVKKAVVKHRVVVHRRHRIVRETTIVLPPAPVPAPIAPVRQPPGHFVWIPALQTYSWVGGTNRPGAFWVDWVLPGVWITQPPAWVWAGTRWN